jgi:hypothetical protein
MNIEKHVFDIGSSLFSSNHALTAEGIAPENILPSITKLLGEDKRTIRLDLNGNDFFFFLKDERFNIVNGGLTGQEDAEIGQWKTIPVYTDNSLQKGHVAVYTIKFSSVKLEICNQKTSLDLCICKKCTHNKIAANKFACDKTTFTGRIHEFFVDGRLVEQQRYLELETDIKDCPYALEHTMSVGNADAKS